MIFYGRHAHLDRRTYGFNPDRPSLAPTPVTYSNGHNAHRPILRRSLDWCYGTHCSGVSTG